MTRLCLAGKTISSTAMRREAGKAPPRRSGRGLDQTLCLRNGSDNPFQMTERAFPLVVDYGAATGSSWDACT